MKCRICGHDTDKAFSDRVMDRYDISYFICPNCEFLQTEEPYWLDEAYRLPINLTDTGILGRNFTYGNYVSAMIATLFDLNGKYVDFAGGYGILTRRMRDLGFDFYWDDQYTTNLIARGFEYKPEMGKVEALVALETFEHFVQPLSEMERMLKLSETIIFSTILALEPVPPKDWWYYTFEHGQHIAFYHQRTLAYLAEKYGMNYYTNGRDFHMFTKKELVPVALEKGQLQDLQKGLSKADAQFLGTCYQPYEHVDYANPKAVVKHVYRSVMYNTYYMLKPGVPDAEKERLVKIFRQTQFMHRYFNDLMVHTEEINKLFASPFLTDRSQSDMLHLQPYVLESHKKTKEHDTGH